MKRKFPKIFTSFILISSLTLSLLMSGCQDNSTSLTTMKLNEVVRSIFYAPLYVAINEGLFEKEGLKIDLSTGQGADKTMQQVLSNASDIGLCGPEQIIYIYNQGRKNPPVIIGQLTQTDGSFLVGKESKDSFKWENLKNKKIIGGRPGGMPEMTFEYALKKHGLTPNKDVTITTNLDFTATSSAFKTGDFDYVTLFEPTASLLEKENSGHIVSPIGESIGSIPYTCFFATPNFISSKPETVEKFLRAIHKGQEWVNSHSESEIVNSVSSFFPGSDKNTLISAVKNYKALNSYATKLTLKEDDLNRLMDIIESYDKKLLSKRPDFNKIVDNSIAEKVQKSSK